MIAVIISILSVFGVTYTYSLGCIAFMCIRCGFFKLLGIHNFNRSFEFSLDESGRIIIIVIIYTLVVGSIIMAVYFMKIKWWWKATVILLLYIAHYVSAKSGLMIYKEGWFTPFTTIAIFSMYLYTYILDKLYVQTEQKVEQGTI